MRRRKRRKQRKIIIISSLTLLFIMAVGYAAFQTNINITAKGNILEEETTINELKTKVTTSGDGLYKDTTETGRYIYRGANPNNYISFNNELWRIISIENDNTLKIIRNESIGNMAWDLVNTRDSSTSTYCLSTTYGCNVWAATSNLVGKPSIFTLYYPNGNPNTDTTRFSGTVTADSSLNTYLNKTYIKTLNDDSRYIVNHNFNVGTPGDHTDTEDIATDIKQEALYKWNGKIGLMNVTDVLKTTTETTCTSLITGYNYSSTNSCLINNWLWSKTENDWTISPGVSSYRGGVWYVIPNRCVSHAAPTSINGVRPVLYLTSNITLSGQGTETNPYIIITT